MPKPKTLAKQIAAGAVLVATPPKARGMSWSYTLDGKPVIIAPEKMTEVIYSWDIWVENLPGDKVRYRAMTKEERKRFREDFKKRKNEIARTP